MLKSLNLLNTIIVSIILLLSCSSNEINPDQNSAENTSDEVTSSLEGNFKILSLGDSYTIGQSVCETCRFPEQLKSELEINYPLSTFQLQVIAQTGWTTTNLINAINSENPDNDFDIVTLLIGVNNQYQNKPFSLYEEEFPFLINNAIEKAKGNKDNVIVVSIPDYAYTPFGNGNQTITQEINTYNNFAQDYCNQNNISYVYITNITRQGLMDPNLVATDGLHPSELAYSKFVERILPVASEKIQ